MNCAVLGAGDLAGDRRFDDEHLLVPRPWAASQLSRRGVGADGYVGALILISLGQRTFGEIRVTPGRVLGEDDDLVDLPRPLGSVFQPE
jgi:hypothetical protein